MSYTISPADERRIAPRFRPTVGTICRLRERKQVALVWNISSTGISMMIADPPPAGTVLAAELVTEGGSVFPFTLHVVHVRQADTGDYLLGGRFDAPLSETDMLRFLAPGTA